jgi:hypothetical protein
LQQVTTALCSLVSRKPLAPPTPAAVCGRLPATKAQPLLLLLVLLLGQQGLHEALRSGGHG